MRVSELDLLPSKPCLHSSVSKLEFLCDAIAEYAGSHDPRSEAYKLRNPLALKEVKVARGESGEKVIQFGGLRKFRSWVHGYDAGLYDLRAKCSGKNRGLTEFSSITDLMTYYGMPDKAAHVADYLSFALEDDGITGETKLFVFLR
jgi:hypothetical protein